MVSPIGLTEKQLLIYQKLYEKCDFRDMTVKYTISQLSSDIKSVEIPEKTIYKNIQILIKKGYLLVISKASKGNAPTYKIVKIIDLQGEPKVSQERTKGEPKSSNISTSDIERENQGRTKGEPKGHPIKEKEKDNNILCKSVDEIVSLYPGRKTKAVRDKKLPGLIKKYGPEQMKRCVQRYVKYVEVVRTTGVDGGSPYQLQYKNEGTFWNSGYEDYLDDNYQEIEEKKPKEKVLTSEEYLKDLYS